MKALVCRQTGALEDLRIEEWPNPVLAPGAVRIRMSAAAINPPDVFMPLGKYHVRPSLPFVPGVEGAGIVTEVGHGVSRLKVGDRVMTYAGEGCLAEQAVVPEFRVWQVPEGMDDSSAAAFVLVNCTAYHAVVDCGRLAPGETIVILGAAGGIGLSAIQIARALQARPIPVVSTPEKLAICREYGAEGGINRTQGALADAICSATGGRGADVILDLVGGESTDAALRAIRPYGRYLLAGAAKGELPLVKGSLIILKQAQLIGVSYRLQLERDPESATCNLGSLVDWWREGKVRPRISKAYAFGDVVQALAHVGSGQAIGKVVVRIP